MPSQMLTDRHRGEIDKPGKDEKSRSMPDQIGNVAGATTEELAKRLLHSTERGKMAGPLEKVYAFWLGGMGCDGCSIAAVGATEPSVEELTTGSIPGLPLLVLHHYVLSLDSGDHFTHALEEAEEGKLDAPYVIVYEGSIADENLTIDGEPWAAEGALPLWSPAEERRRIPTAEWVRRLSPGAAAVIAIGTCATWGGIPAAAGNPTGSMSVMDFLGKEYRSAFGLPVINVPGCAPVGDNFTETVAMLLMFLNKQGPLPEFDDVGRPLWQMGETVHRHCPRAGWYEEGTFAKEFGDKECLVEIGCWGPVVNCNITERGAVGHMGGCMVSGGVCIGCTMPGFPDKFTPFYVTPPGSRASTMMSKLVGSFVRPLRRMTQLDRNREKRWDESKAVPSGWSLDYDTTSLSHQVAEFFYDKLQYFGSTRPGRKKKETQYNSGWTTPAESAYGEAYQKLPADREKLAREKGLRRRSELKGPPREAAVRKDS
jgi:hydrogenase small subunit